MPMLRLRTFTAFKVLVFVGVATTALLISCTNYRNDRVRGHKQNLQYIGADYSDLWLLSDNLKNYWLHAFSCKAMANATPALYDGYKVISGRISHSIASQRDAKVRRDLHELSSEFKDFWRFVQEFWLNGKKTNEIASRYGKLRSPLLRAVEVSRNAREAAMEHLEERVHRRLWKLQHPDNCSSARIVICKIIISYSGFGSEVHWLTNCVLSAFERGRTAVQISRGWQYSEAGWEFAMLPISNCQYSGTLEGLPGIDDNEARVVQWSVTDRKASAWTVPAELEPELSQNHGHPVAWWIGQFVSYVTRHQEWIESKIRDISERIGFQSPIVGIHIRRGDKLRIEAKRHEVGEYMFYVEQWFTELELRQGVTRRRVYLATDDNNAKDELVNKYPRYEFITSGRLRTKGRNEVALEGILLDLHFLSHCDYVVCTMSSNVCRFVYERIASTHTDAPLRIQSLDSAYYFPNLKRLPWVAVSNHTHSQEGDIDLRVGDDLELFTDSQQILQNNNGFVFVKNSGYRPTGRKGFVPAYKIRETVPKKRYFIP